MKNTALDGDDAVDEHRAWSTGRKLTVGGASALGVLGAAAIAGVGIARSKVDGYVDPWIARVDAAGFSLKSEKVGDVEFSYAEGPVNGTPLVLLHAQQMDWFSYSRVLPRLARSFHVIDVDYQAHGATTTPADYEMTANVIGADLARFLDRVVGEPAYVSGNSSGGLLAAWLAANRPEAVRGVLLEDPPLFASEYPRIKKTIADRDFASSDAAVQQQVDDFLLFWIQDSKPFFDKRVGKGSAFALTQAIKSFRRANPGRPVEIGLIPDDTIRLFLRGMQSYDPRFGQAFHRGTWNAGFDHAEALRAIRCPALLLHANFSWVDGDVLYGAMDQDDADRAMTCLSDGTYHRIDATHVTHLAAPEGFSGILENYFLVENP